MKKKNVILLVDDVPQNNELLEAYLLPQGYEIITANSGEEALKKIDTAKIDLILLDVTLPGISGFEVMHRIRQDSVHRLLPIILVTALHDREDRVRGIEAGCDGFLTKPVDKIEMIAWVKSLLKVKAYNDLLRTYRTELESQVKKRIKESQRLTLHLLHAREEERKLIAREIHDELGQILAAIKMDLQWIEKKSVQSPAPVQTRIHDVVGLADKTIEMVHQICSELRPGILDDLGLQEAIEWLGIDFTRKQGIPCYVDFTATESTIGTQSTSLVFRIVQEALINVAHHAHASNCSVELWEENRTLMVRIKDDGVGITDTQSKSLSAFGLIGIRERVQGLLGAVKITGIPEKGTTLMIQIPLPQEGVLP